MKRAMLGESSHGQVGEVGEVGEVEYCLNHEQIGELLLGAAWIPASMTGFKLYQEERF